MLFASLLLAMTGVWLGAVLSREVSRCVDDNDCPPGALCYKDECPRCLCKNGTVLDKLYDGGILTEICNPRFVYHPRVGDACGRDEQCPYQSVCQERVCVCRDGLVPNERYGTHCRPVRYGEACDTWRPCDDRLGFICILPLGAEQQEEGNMTVVRGICGCKVSHHRPTRWSRFVLGRWDYAAVESSPQECVARAVGEPCKSNEECSAIQGSGAVCGPCGYCECQRESHVPDILGTKCGHGRTLGQKCSLKSRFVCDGTLGLQCGDVCDLYASSYGFKRKHCTCSQMHDSVGSSCVPNTIGNTCSTDLDCFPIKEGFGYCENGRCQANESASPSEYLPYTVDRECLLQKLSPDQTEKPARPDKVDNPDWSANVSYTIQPEVPVAVEGSDPGRKAKKHRLPDSQTSDQAKPDITNAATNCAIKIDIIKKYAISLFEIAILLNVLAT